MEVNSEFEKQSIQNLKQILLSNLNVEFVRDLGRFPLGGDYTPDGYLDIRIGGEEKYLVVEVKSQVDHLRQISKFLQFANSFSGISFLVAGYISDLVKRQLVEKGIGFLELEKDFSFSFRLKENLIPFVDTHKKIGEVGFRTEGLLKLLFYLTVKNGGKFTQRELSGALGISLGSVNAAIRVLEEAGLLRKNRGEIKLTDKKKIFSYWTELYKADARDRISLGRFSPITPSFYSDWQAYDLLPTHSYWGGEPAVRKISDYLTPGFYTIYTYDSRLASLLKSLKLKKDPLGKIEILKAFWPEDLNDSIRRTVPDFLVLSDLISSGIDRNIEAANDLVQWKSDLRVWL